MDLRDHGSSELQPADLSLGGFVEDAVRAGAEFESAPIVVGQSLGGSIAIALAAYHPELVHALVLVEAGPTADPDAARVVRRWLESWPTPFRSRTDAETFFGGGLAAAASAAGLADTADGLRPVFHPNVVEGAVRDVAGMDLWNEWRRIECPVLVIRGDRGSLDRSEADRMVLANQNALLAEVEAAGHDIHLDNSAGLR